MPFIVRSTHSSEWTLHDNYLDLTFASLEGGVDLENIFNQEALYVSSVPPNALYTAIDNGDLVRRDDTNTYDIAAVNAFDDAIWRWAPTRGQKEALVGTVGSPSATNRYITETDSLVRSLHINSSPYRYGNLSLQQGTGVTLSDDGAGNFTIAAVSSDTSDFRTSVGLGLNVDYASGKAWINGTFYSVSSGTITLPSSITGGSIYVNTSGVVVASSTLPSNTIPFAVFNTSSTIVTMLSDRRAWVNPNLVFGTEVTTLIPDLGTNAGSLDKYARIDHAHAIDTDAPVTDLTATTVNTEGSSTSFSRSDHGHQILTGPAVMLTPDLSNTVGTSSSIARSDHIHNVPTGLPVTIASTNSSGTASSFSKSDHIHAHGSQTDSSMHALATTASAGFISSTDKTKLDSLIVKKAGIVLGTSFSGNPKKASVTFTSNFVDSNYSVVITSASNVRTWSYESKTVSGFTINANANAALVAEVSWIAVYVGEGY